MQQQQQDHICRVCDAGEAVCFVCIQPDCRESSRLMCNDCVIFAPSHQGHESHVVKIEELFNSSYPVMEMIKSAKFFPTSSILSLSKAQIDLYFDLIEQQVLEELREARGKLVSAVRIRDRISEEIQLEAEALQRRIVMILETSKKQINSRWSDKQSYFRESSHEEISTRITAQLKDFETRTSRTLLHNELLVKQTVRACEISLQKFDEDLKIFLAAHTSSTICEHLFSTTSSSESTMSSPYSIQLHSASDFYQTIGYASCLAVNNIGSLDHYTRVAAEICATNCGEQRIFYSLAFNKQNVDDVQAKIIAEHLNNLTFLPNIHIDLDDNKLTNEGYQSILKALIGFVRIDHLDIRLNRNSNFDAESLALLQQLLEKNKRYLTGVCLTMRQLGENKDMKISLMDLDVSNDSTATVIYNGKSGEKCKKLLFHSLTGGKSISRQSSQIKQTTNFSETAIFITQTLSIVENLQVVYLDFSDNDLSAVGEVEMLAPIGQMKSIHTIHIVMNRTNIPNNQPLALLDASDETHPLRYFKLFLKDNGYTFQQERTIAGKFQKAKAEVKNFDIFC